MLIADRLISDGGWISRKGVTCFNLYRPPLTHRLEKCGYVPVRNDFAKDGLWKIETREVIYVDSALSITARRAANDLIEAERKAAESIRQPKAERFWDR